MLRLAPPCITRLALKGVGALACIPCAVAVPLAGYAQAADVDWKFYGGASIDGDSLCFYDAKGAIRGPEGRIRVWTKCLPQKDMDDIDIKKDFAGKIAERAAQKVVDHYVPPVAAVEDIDFDQMLAIVGYEETANTGNVQYQARILYELSCSERRLRELSIDIKAKGGRGSSDKPGDWRHVPPEGNGATLLKILCPL
jgi:hypothetical protein